jgi:PAS domain S-box-containing protein
MATAVPQDRGAPEAVGFASSRLLAFGLAVAAVAAAVPLTLVIRHTSGNPTFFLFYAAIFVSVWFAGRGPGVLATALCALALHLLFRSSGGLLAVTGEKIPTLLACIASLATADMLSTQRHRAERALRTARDRLEAAVQERTSELRRANDALTEEIGERTRAEGALRASELRWRRMYEASSAAMILLRLDGRFVGANAAFQKMVGYSEDELKKLTAFDITPAEERPATVQALAEFAAGQRNEYHVEKRYMRKDGSAVWFNATTTLAPASDRTPAHLQAILIDITERKRADAALRASEERWRRLFAGSSTGMALTDLDARYIATNAAFQNMLGYTAEEFKALTAVEITHPDEVARTRDVVADFVSGARQEYRVDKRYLKKDGTPLWVNVTTTYLPATDVTPAMLQGVYVNIDDRKRAEAALRASEARMRAIFSAAPVGIATSDENRQLMRANPALRRMLGYSEDEMRALGWTGLTHEDDRAASQAWVAGVIEGRRQPPLEKRYLRKDGEIAWAAVNSAFVPASDTTPAFFAAIVADITDRVRAEEALHRSQSELARVSRITTMGQLTASIAHEMNQPLTAIIASGNACERWLANGVNLVRAKESLARMIGEANRASEVIKRIRSLAGNAASERVELDVNAVVREVLALARAELQAKRVRVQANLDGAIPPVRVDRVQLQQVLLNLIVNAIDAMAGVNDRPRLLAITTERDEEASVRVTVQDSGAGLAPESAEHIFQPFFTTKPAGMGMGLSISTTIIETHGGRLWASPAPINGTAFHFTLPTAA